ncbi:hypothetical protein ATY81_25170 [Rhizobium sp. R72]|uniref:YceI family protein n=1 Tax=unclassified Rhizobium TaxID=2613769 RepID=UPI000B52A8BB|nr:MULTISPECIES: YceI family protein [unclassified Rhizobium]OWW00093.1 hypothetical protein ATY81_25170 [Rhizobium sp. R72]OWW00484.1 hypothetical protein ATY80_25170 [Rhizobium sp. R711]
MLHIPAFALALGVSTTLALAAVSDPAPAGAYKTDPSHSSFNWSFNHSGLSRYTARFTKVDARLDWKPEKPETSTLSVTIDPLSVRTDYPWPQKVDFDAEIGGEETFLAAKPITFVSKTIHVTGHKTGTVEGLLTLRGETHPATLDVTFNGSMAKHPMMGVAKIGFSATGRIRRSEWGMDFAIPELGDVVTFAIETQMVPADYSFQ